MEIMKGDNMLVINVIFKIKNGSREDFLKIVREEGIDAASRNEEGNYRYDFFFSMEDPEDIFLLEFWKDQDAHSFHRTLPHYARLDEIKEDGVNILLIEQNAKAALEISDYAYVMETGVITMTGPGKALLNDPRVQQAYLGE